MRVEISASRSAWKSALVIVSLFGATSAFADDGAAEGGGAADLAALLQDPLATLSAVTTDSKVFFRSGKDNDEAYLVAIQPVYSLPFEEQGVILIPRLNIPIISLKPGLDLPRLGGDEELSARDKSRESGLSDIGAQLFVSPHGRDVFGWKVGLGPQFSFNTRTDTDLKGAGYGMGPSVVVAGGIGDFSIAAILGHMWSFDKDFSTTTLQPMIYYNIAMFPGAYLFYNNSIAFDYKTKGGSGNRWTVPVGIGAGKTFDVGGGHGFDMGVGYYHQPSWGRPDGGPEHELQITATWIFPR